MKPWVVSTLMRDVTIEYGMPIRVGTFRSIVCITNLLSCNSINLASEDLANI